MTRLSLAAVAGALLGALPACAPEPCDRDWPATPAGVDVVHVSASADCGEACDGTRRRPYPSISAALGSVASGDAGAVAVAAGTYPERVVIGPREGELVIAGVCSDRVVIEEPADGLTGGDSLGIVAAPGAGAPVTLSGLTVVGSNFGVDLTEGGFTLADVAVERARIVGLRIALGATVEAEGLQVRDIAEPDATGSSHGIQVDGAATLVASDVVVTAVRGTGIDGRGGEDGGCVVSLRDVVSSFHGEVAGGPVAQDLGKGLEIGAGCAADIVGGRFEDNDVAGLLARDGGRIAAAEVVVDGAGSPTGRGVFAAIEGEIRLAACRVENQARGGVLANDGGVVTLEGCTFAGNGRFAAEAFGAGAEVELDDCDIDSGVIGDEGLGSGVEAAVSGRLTMRGGHIRDVAGFGALAVEAAVLTLEGVSIGGVHATPQFPIPVGLAADAGSDLLAEDVEVADVAGPGIYVRGGSTVDCDRCSILRSEGAGAACRSGWLLLSSSTIEGTESGPALGGSYGVLATPLDLGWTQLACIVALQDVTIGPHDYASVALQHPGYYTLRDVRVEGSDGSARSAPRPSGDGVVVDRGVGSAFLTLEDVSIEGCAGAGLLLHGASATVSGLAFEGNAVDLVQDACAFADATPPVGWEDQGSAELCPEPPLWLEIPAIDIIPAITPPEPPGR